MVSGISSQDQFTLQRKYMGRGFLTIISLVSLFYTHERECNNRIHLVMVSSQAPLNNERDVKKDIREG